ncbi:hypothetical protein AAC387_Pa01g2967 [Persea americana]
MIRPLDNEMIKFPEVAELLNVCWLEIYGKLDARILSPKTTYKVYIVFKCVENSYGRLPVKWNDRQDPLSRSDGWMEMVMGEFFNDEGEEGDVEITFMEIKGGRWKSRLIIEGIEIRH